MIFEGWTGLICNANSWKFHFSIWILNRTLSFTGLCRSAYLRSCYLHLLAIVDDKFYNMRTFQMEYLPFDFLNWTVFDSNKDVYTIYFNIHSIQISLLKENVFSFLAFCHLLKFQILVFKVLPHYFEKGLINM